MGVLYLLAYTSNTRTHPQESLFKPFWKLIYPMWTVLRGNWPLCIWRQLMGHIRHPILQSIYIYNKENIILYNSLNRFLKVWATKYFVACVTHWFYSVHACNYHISHTSNRHILRSVWTNPKESDLSHVACFKRELTSLHLKTAPGLTYQVALKDHSVLVVTLTSVIMGDRFFPKDAKETPLKPWIRQATCSSQGYNSRLQPSVWGELTFNISDTMVFVYT